MRSKSDQHQQDQVAIVWQAFQGNILQYLGSDKFYKIISPFVPKNTFLGELSAYVLGIALILYTSRWNAWSTWTILLIEMKSHQGNGCELLPVKARLQAIGSPAISSWGAQMTGALFGLARQIFLTPWKHLYLGTSLRKIDCCLGHRPNYSSVRKLGNFLIISTTKRRFSCRKKISDKR